jgi:hypothetical protein
MPTNGRERPFHLKCLLPPLPSRIPSVTGSSRVVFGPTPTHIHHKSRERERAHSHASSRRSHAESHEHCRSNSHNIQESQLLLMIKNILHIRSFPSQVNAEYGANSLEGVAGQHDLFLTLE